MAKVRLCYVLKLRSGGLWGSGKRLLEADVVTVSCRHPSGVEVACIPHTYIKGLLRRNLEEVVHHLARLKIVDSETVVEELFGPLTPFRGEVWDKPCRTIVAPLYPVKNLEIAMELARSSELSYLERNDYLAIPQLYGEPHVRIDDRSQRVASGALFRELRVVPSTLFYGEVIHYAYDNDRLRDAARALTIAVAMLGYRYVGRKTVAEVRILRIEPEELANDEYIKTVLENQISSSSR